MPSIKITGVIKNIFPSEVYGNNFEKKVFYLKEPDTEKYPQTFSIELHQGDTNKLDSFSYGDVVTCHINIKGREWVKGERSGCINTLQCWKIELVNKQSETQPAPQPAPVKSTVWTAAGEGVTDELPF
jgi:hypothetical protein